jgi:hypothetical protein
LCYFSHRSIEVKNDILIKNKISKLNEKKVGMLSLDKNSRPNCQQVLAEKSEWYLSLDDLTDDKEFKEIISKRVGTHSLDECFHRYFILQKTEFMFKCLDSVKNTINDNRINELWQKWHQLKAGTRVRDSRSRPEIPTLDPDPKRCREK